ncbi:phosphoglycerate kinase [Chishuiella changwenlii]|uniref:Phosphoglycerate kinase n=1 Tax=Chishuiella changwenlii TaxID=1434701 RepID=A0A1M6YRK6_9FLAO|nr:phosphoglycerate kinase [Chishuiella changwenlii]GGE88537.1 phosphoglycerate kinase [Chishuiella changwenlii]SHL20780.1 phosphoglycerate kinase [Chishuiella changwenlii]
MKTINDYNFENKKALIRVDFNVPQDENLNVTDDTRIKAAKPTIDKILKDGGAVILMSHLGRPKGEFNDKYSLKHIAPKVSEILGVNVIVANDVIGDDAKEKVANLKAGEVLLLENVRFHNEEENGDKDFAKQLASFGDIYVNDAFGTAHRAHASTAIIAEFFPENKCFGLLMEQELVAINKVLTDGEKPVTAVLGGSKVSSKITIINNILPAIDNLIIGGGMTYTFVKANGGKIGTSLVEDDKLDLAKEILAECEKHNVKVYLPIDNVVADDFNNDANSQTVKSDEIPDNWMGMDVGVESSKNFAEVIAASKTILWNGPLGVFEMPNFAKGTIALGDAIAEATKNGAFSLVGGGDSVAFVKQFGYDDKVSYVSTGGGAMLESLEGKELPGVAAILK